MPGLQVKPQSPTGFHKNPAIKGGAPNSTDFGSSRRILQTFTRKQQQMVNCGAASEALLRLGRRPLRPLPALHQASRHIPAHLLPHLLPHLLDRTIETRQCGHSSQPTRSADGAAVNPHAQLMAQQSTHTLS
eukprot:356820-Chlamydomonas_euryale.AAC.5